MKILVLNAGSSSHKSCLFDLTRASDPGLAPTPIWRAALDWTHAEGQVELTATTATGAFLQTVLPLTNRADGIAAMLNTLVAGDTAVIAQLSEIDGVGHRVVHGGQDYVDSVRIDEGVKGAIQRLIPLAPAHNPANLQGIEAMDAILGKVPQVAVFDTAFHARMPDYAATYPGPYTWVEQGIQRYGFHGTSHRYVAQRAASLLGRDLASLNLITCHLGNGCSLAAVQGGYSIDTTMGFTPLEGLMMGSRSGSVDPGILLHLLRQGDHTGDSLDQLLNKGSGIKGISGVSNDLRRVIDAMEQGNPRAKLAVEMFVHRLRQGLGAMLASLGGLDALVFTAGIGENSPLIWEKACEPFAFLGLKLQETPSRAATDQDIAAPDSTVRVLVIHTQEEWAIAQACLTLVG